ncbi:MAG: bacteriohemerythrin, partial [Gammaproteobacteria bacterium]|nr:bacteriohemerythrin [Gammaproteobacteria bacterium]
ASIASQFGSVIFRRADRADLEQLQDLKGSSLMAVNKNSLGGFHMAWGELQSHDIDIYEDFSRLEFGGVHDAVVDAVLKGAIDVGIVRTDTLERMAQEGKIDLADLRVIHQHLGREQEDYPFLHSTEIYPEWPFASLASTPFELAQTVSVALLRMAPESNAAVAAQSAGWGIPLNYQPVHELLKSLRVGIYQDYGKIKPWDVLRLYWYWYLLGLLVLIAMTAVTIHVVRLNAHLKSSRQSLKDARDTLELRVQERTRKLEQTLQSLQQTSREKRLLLDSAGEGIYGVNSKGEVCFANAFTVNSLGWREDELIGNNIHDLSHHTRTNGEAYSAEDCPVHSTLRQRTVHHISDEIFWRKDGSSFPVEYTSTPIIEDGEQKGAVVVFKDITQRRQTEEALRRTQKMDALGKLTGGIAHDFNNMLGVILGYSDLLLHRIDDDSKLETYAQQIKRAGERAKILTARLLAFSRKNIPVAEPTDINQLLLDSRHMLEKTLTARIEIVLDIDDGIWPVNLDRASLEDAILNMSINAMHAIAETGTLTLATRNTCLEKGNLVQGEIEAGDYVLLTITDTGSGMDEETRQHIFDPFYSTKGEQGTGLGMSQVYSFVEQSGGVIVVDSELGKGTQMALYFPRYDQAVSNIKTQNTSVLENGSKGHETILVVDDEDGLRELTRDTLSNYGYRVLCAENSRQALELLKTEPVDLLLSDVIMPMMDGYQLAEEVAKNYPQVKIQMVSGFSDECHLGRNEALYQKQLQKPFTSKALLERLRELLDENKASSVDELLQPVIWSSEISTGIDPVDKDHKILLVLLNRCIDAVQHNMQGEAAGNILEELLDYTGYHFRREELIMAVCHYPGLHGHQQAHSAMLDEVAQYIREYSEDRLSVQSLLQFLRCWFLNHVNNKAYDRAIIPFCEGKKDIIKQALVEAGLDH